MECFHSYLSNLFTQIAFYLHNHHRIESVWCKKTQKLLILLYSKTFFRTRQLTENWWRLCLSLLFYNYELQKCFANQACKVFRGTQNEKNIWNIVSPFWEKKIFGLYYDWPNVCFKKTITLLLLYTLKPLQNKKGQKNLGCPRKKQSFSL